MAVEPNVQYQWKDDAKFELSGREFEFLINSVRLVLTTPESQRILMLAQANNVLENLLAKGIETGQVVPLEKKEDDAVPELEVTE